MLNLALCDSNFHQNKQLGTVSTPSTGTHAVALSIPRQSKEEIVSSFIVCILPTAFVSARNKEVQSFYRISCQHFS